MYTTHSNQFKSGGISMYVGIGLVSSKTNILKTISLRVYVHARLRYEKSQSVISIHVVIRLVSWKHHSFRNYFSKSRFRYKMFHA